MTHIRIHAHLELCAALRVLHRGECLARDVASAQQTIAPERKIATFLSRQARQEAMHARVFGAVIAHLDPRDRTRDHRRGNALEVFAGELAADTAAGRFTASVIGLQCVLEGLGSAILSATEPGLAGLDDRYRRMHRLIHSQETTHHQLGGHWIGRQLLPWDRLVQTAGIYQSIAMDILGENEAILTQLGADLTAVRNAVTAAVPVA